MNQSSRNLLYYRNDAGDGSDAAAAEAIRRHNDETDDEISDSEDDGYNYAPFKYEPPVFASTVVTDPHRLAQWQKQIDLGKNTVGYYNYTQSVPRYARQRFNPIHPVTPDITDATLSKRRFYGQVRAWRRALHYWDILPGQPLPPERLVAPNPAIARRPFVQRPKKKLKLTEGDGEDGRRVAKLVDVMGDSGGAYPTSQSSQPKDGRFSSLFDDFDL